MLLYCKLTPDLSHFFYYFTFFNPVFEDNKKKPLIVLQHGDSTVDTKALALAIDVKKVSMISTTPNT